MCQDSNLEPIGYKPIALPLSYTPLLDCWNLFLNPTIHISKYPTILILNPTVQASTIRGGEMFICLMVMYSSNAHFYSFTSALNSSRSIVSFSISTFAISSSLLWRLVRISLVRVKASVIRCFISWSIKRAVSSE